MLRRCSAYGRNLEATQRREHSRRRLPTKLRKPQPTILPLHNPLRHIHNPLLRPVSEGRTGHAYEYNVLERDCEAKLNLTIALVTRRGLGELVVSYRPATTISSTRVRLYEEVLKRILRKHGELNGMDGLILDAVTSPDLVLSGHGKELLAVKHYERTPLGAKDIVVVYREDKHLIITAFLTSDPLKLVRKRAVVWQRQSK